MEVIRISNQKLKIMLTSLDMLHFEINPEGFSQDSAAMHRAFRRLLDEIHRQIDFEADDKHISVQYFPSREGGCEMFISNLPEKDASLQAVKAESSLPQKGALTTYSGSRECGGFQRDCAFRFEKLTYLLAACKRLYDIDFLCESTAWCDDRHSYFLLLTLRAPSPYCIPEELDFMVEYGAIENASTLRLYFHEHGKPLCTSEAIKRLAELF